MEVKTSLACGLQKSIGSLWKGDCLSDFTVVAGGTSFQCHRFILSACSGFFQALFRSQMRESQENQAELQGMTASIFDVILNSVYRGVDGLTKENVLDVWSSTEQLQIRYLTEECENFAINNVTVDDCFSILRHARLYSAEKVETDTLVFLSKQIEQLSKMENFLKLPFADFYRVIESDHLTASSEDVVVETVLKWVDYTHLHSSDCKEKSKGKPTRKNSTLGQRTLPDVESSQTSSLSESLSNSDSAEVMPGSKDQSKGTDRKQHLFTLISTCRLYLISPSCLDTLIHNTSVLFCQEALTFVADAMMYKLCLERRHDPWPEPAVHRVTSNMKHVMVFLSNSKFMAYNLNTGSVHEFADLPGDYRSHAIFTVFDNVLYLGYTNNQNQREFHTFVDHSWEKVNNIGWRNYNTEFFAHKNRIYFIDYRDLYYCTCLSGHNRKWNLLCSLNNAGQFSMFFLQYFLALYTESDSSIGVLYYNVKTKQTGTFSSSMQGTAHGMVSFTHLGEVFLLQKNGSLWKIFSTDTDLVDFQLVSKLWDEDVDLKGCVVYRKELFVFHLKSNPIVPTVTEIHLGSVTDLLIKIKMVAVNSNSSCLPMVLPQSWFIVENSK